MDVARGRDSTPRDAHQNKSDKMYYVNYRSKYGTGHVDRIDGEPAALPPRLPQGPPSRKDAFMEAREMVARAVSRYGGRSRWEKLCLTASPRGLRGLVPWSKGNGRTFALPPRVELRPARGEATFFDYPEPGSTGRYVRGQVALGESGLREHRHVFRSLDAKFRRWSPWDALYFFGYAMTHYHALPFVLADAEVRRWNPRRRTLTVAFGADVHTHCRLQTFHFAEDGLILRHDYVADIVGPWARGAHFWCEYQDVSGFPFATHRRVLARLLSLPLPLLALDAQLASPSATLDPRVAAARS